MNHLPLIKKYLRTTFLSVALLGLALPPACAQESAPRKKLIWYGWNMPLSYEIPKLWPEIDKLPLDGLVIDVPVDPSKPARGNNTTGNRLGWSIFDPTPLKIENFKNQIADLKTAKWKNISAPFLTSAAASFGQDKELSWFDDARWATITNNWRTLATIAREGGCRGIMFDPEHYDYASVGAELFNYEGHRAKRANKSFAEYQAKVRQRGRQLMEAVQDVYPDMTMLCFYAYDLALYDDQNQRKKPEDGRYSLLSSFLDGMLEGSHPRTKWTDSWEFAYGYKQRTQFLEAYHSVRQKAMYYSKVPELYAAKMRAGFGLMMDYNYIDKWSTDDIARNHFSPSEWQNAVRQALDISDEYVIVYTQGPNFLNNDKLPAAYLQATIKGRQLAQESLVPPLFSVPVEWQETASPKPASASPQVPATSLLAGGDFEAVRAVQETRQPTGWFVQDWEKSVEDDLPSLLNDSGLTTEVAHSGKQSYKFIVTDEVYAKFGPNTVYRMGRLKSKNVPVQAGEKLALSFWYKADDMKGIGDMVVQFHKTGAPTTEEQAIAGGSRVQFDTARAWRELGPQARITAEADGWHKVEVPGIVVPEGYRVAQVVVHILGTKPGDYLYLDDVALTRG